MRKPTLLFLFTVFFYSAAGAGADEITLSGVDSRMTAVTGIVNLYAIVTDNSGRIVENLKAEDFIVMDAPAGENPEVSAETREIVSFTPSGERREGITFMMLIDDSGSMYGNPGGDRASLARREARNFLDSLGNSMDRAGLALFGTRYRVLAGPRTDRASLYERLGLSAPPEPEEAYTELFASMVEASDSLRNEKGRRILILFSDGENYPYFQRSGEKHPEYGEKTFAADDALVSLQGEGITLYAVRFGPRRDEDLARIALSTGGLVFDISAEEELSGLYSLIRKRVQAEYRLGYSPGLTGARETSVMLKLSGGSSSAVLNYPSGFVFGEPSRGNQALLSLLVIPFVLLILFILSRLWRRKPGEPASLERLRPVGGGALTVALESGKTLISPGVAGAATTIMPSGVEPDVQGGGTLIVEKGKDGRWRISSDEGVVVNNRKSESTVLENGDVIKAGEELIVFDNGES